MFVCVLPPWQPYFFCPVQPPGSSTPGSAAAAAAATGMLRRCRALYDCDADNIDELSFREGEVILVTNQQTDDDNWMEGIVESEPTRRGMFPISFVHMLTE